jgi:hypothetical protein
MRSAVAVASFAWTRLAHLAYRPFSSDHTRCRQNPHALKQGLLEQRSFGNLNDRAALCQRN